MTSQLRGFPAEIQTHAKCNVCSWRRKFPPIHFCGRILVLVRAAGTRNPERPAAPEPG